MPGFGRSAFSLPSMDFYNFSNTANFSQLHGNVQNYRFRNTVYSHKSGEHLRVGIDVGLNIWSIIPIIDEKGVITNISVIASPPIRPRDRPLLPELKHQQRSTNNANSTTSNATRSKKLNDKSAWTDSKFRFILYGASGAEITLPVEKTQIPSHNMVILNCAISSEYQIMIQEIVASEKTSYTLALHDQDLNLYWNFSTPCLTRSIKETGGNLVPKSTILNSEVWKQVETPVKHDLSAVLIIRNETLDFVREWLTNFELLGFDHVFVYKQQRLGESLADIDTLLLQYVQKQFVTVQPFFDVQPNCDFIHDFNTHLCESSTTGYSLLFQDALFRYSSAWMLLVDANEMLIVPSATNTLSNNTLRIDSPRDIKSYILNTLKTSLRATGASNGTLALSSFSFGSGPKSLPTNPYRKTGTLAMETMNWRAEYPTRRRFFATGGFPNLISNSVGRIDPFDIRAHAYQIQYKGALLENNQLQDNSTSTWARHVKSRLA
jgi:hypothetical protein